MFVFFRNGRSVHLGDAIHYEIFQHDSGVVFLVCFGKRKRQLAWFPMDGVSGYCFDNEKITTYTSKDQVDKPWND